MDSFFNKFGFYEIISYLLAGTYEVLFSSFMLFFSLKKPFSYTNVKDLFVKINNIDISIQTTIILFLLFLLCGMLFNEIGELVKSPLRKIGKKSKKSYGFSIDDNEMSTAKSILSQKLNLKEENISDNYMFNYANAYIAPKRKSFIRKAQTLASFFRGLIAYLFVFTSITFITSALIALIDLTKLILNTKKFFWSVTIIKFLCSNINWFQLIVWLISLFLALVLFPIIEKKYSSILHSFTIRQFIIENK